MDNVFIESPWRSLKYKKLRLWSYDTVSQVETQITEWMGCYNLQRKHRSLEYELPWNLYRLKSHGEGSTKANTTPKLPLEG